MIELMRTTDPVWLSFVEALLRDAGIESIRLDQHMSVMEGSLSILPQRLMVADEDEAPAKRLLA